MTTAAETRRTTATRRPGPGTILLRLFSSIWLGITLLVLLFLYGAIGSALPTVRQHPFFDMTEMEWFNAWPFQLLAALLCVNIIVVSIRRIPFRLEKAGVWMAHLGILLLSAGSVYYFGTKLEGDTPVFRRRAVIQLPNRPEPITMVVRPGSQASALVDQGKYRFSVEQINPKWPILTGEDEGKTAYAVFIGVQTPTERFTRIVLDGYPAYTEDLLPDRTRAKKSTGVALVDDQIDIQLDYEPQEHFYLAGTAALYARGDGDEDWSVRRIDDCPRYHSHLATYDEVWIAPGDAAPDLDPIDITLEPETPDDPLAGIDVRVTGYLRYAQDRVRWVDGGKRLNPLIRVVRIQDGETPVLSELLALEDDRKASSDKVIRFEWVESQDALDALAAADVAHLQARIPGDNITARIPIDRRAFASLDPDVPFQPIEGSGYSVRIRNCADGLPLPDGRVVSVAILEIRHGDQTFTRMVASDPTATRDMVDQDQQAFAEPDPAIETTYHPSELAPVTIVAGPDPLSIIVLQPAGGTVTRLPVDVGGTVETEGAGSLRIESLLVNARPQLRPEIVPRHQRDRDARETYSQLEVTLSQGDWAQPLWLPFNAYALPSEQYAVRGRIAYITRQITLPDGKRVDLMFSRERRPLGERVALEDFSLRTHTGGYTGATSSIRDFVSRLRFEAAGSGSEWTSPVTLAVNRPVTIGPLSLFQAQWDPPAADSPGMNYTGLGVGNRNGVWIQLTGAIITALGMAFAFYVKPRLGRRESGLAPTRGLDEESAESLLGADQASRAGRRLAMVIGVSIVALIVLVTVTRSRPAETPQGFADQVNLDPLATVAVQDAGRVKSFDSFARTVVRRICGRRGLAGQSTPYTYFDLMLRPELYAGKDIIYVKNKAVRARLARALSGVSTFDEARREQFLETGLIAPALLRHPRSSQQIDRMARDVLRTAKAVDQIRAAVLTAEPQALADGLRVIPPPGADSSVSWLPGAMVWGAAEETIPVPGLDADLGNDIRRAWQTLATAWLTQDADAVNVSVDTLAGLLPQIAPDVYPSLAKLRWESWYFRYKALVWTWTVYLLAAVPLLMSVIYRWRAARVTGLLLFLVAFGLHTASLGIRWYLSGRIPNSNMYEAVTASTWFGGTAALVFELVVRNRPTRGLFALGAAICAATAMMCSHFMPVQLNSDIENIMPVLHDVWLYIHTNVVIFSYCLIGMGAVTALLYLVYRMVGGPADYARSGGMSALLLGGRSTGPTAAPRTGQVLDAATMVLMEFATLLLFAGIVMGAVWADHSWGRPWGWDPKEVFALNTLIIFLLLLHVRLIVKDKGLWTATLACTGCVVMLFNWIVINFVITGLHSYA